jgi:hypothetical protein
MRITRAAVAVAAAGLALLAAGCRANGTGSTGATGAGASAGASGPASAAAPGGAAASCVVGSWRAASLDLTIATNGATTRATGGSGYTLTIGPDGKTVVDFTGMQPVTFTTTVSSTEVKGQFSYGGKVLGTLRVASGSSGEWQSVGTTDWSSLTVTVELLSPVRTTVVNGVKISDFAGTGAGQAGGAVDSQPILRRSTFRCSGDTLTLGPPQGSPVGGTWTLHRS